MSHIGLDLAQKIFWVHVIAVFAASSRILSAIKFGIVVSYRLDGILSSPQVMSKGGNLQGMVGDSEVGLAFLHVPNDVVIPL